jgi:rhamnosyltransferase subunit B
LRARGHRVTVVASGQYADLSASHWLEFRELVSAERMRALFSKPDVWHPIKTARHTANWSHGIIEPHYRLLTSLASESDSVLITNPSILGAGLVQETLGRPLITVILQPWMIPSPSAPPIMPIPGMPLRAPRFLHAIFFRLIEFAADRLVCPELNRARRSLGLKPARRILHYWFSKQLVLAMFPDWYGPPQPDWPPQIQLTGFPRFDAALNRSLPPGLHEFLSKPKPTIVFTFGSGMMHGSQLFEIASRACERLNAQGLFINRFQFPSPPQHMFHAPFVPFSEVFPRCAAVVHHGGIGTTAECLAAGNPQLILPLGFDQLDNAIRIQNLGAGLHAGSKHHLVARAQAIPARELNEISGMLSKLLQPSFQTSAAAFANRVRSENGIETAADAIQKFLAPR